MTASGSNMSMNQDWKNGHSRGVSPHLLMRNAGVGQIHACVAGFLCQLADPKRIDLWNKWYNCICI